MPAYTHGGDLYAAEAQFGGAVLDFSANLNPLGMPDAVRQAAQAAVDSAVHYPDALCRALTSAIAAHDGVAPERILCGNGAADLIFRLCFALRPRHALLTAPTFSEYEQALRAADCRVFYHRLSASNGFALTGSVLDALTPGLSLAFLCNPNNPTGQAVDEELLFRILDRCAGMKIRLVVDECFLELSDGAAGGGLARYVQDQPNLILLRAFTKSYAIPGLRLGYCITSDTALLDRLSLCAQPWSVSAPAQAAGIAALRCPEHPAAARAIIAEERAWLTGHMGALGLTVFPSTCNYLLFQAKEIPDLKERMLARGVLIRSCANYVGLGPDYYRIAVRNHPENETLIQRLREVL